MSATVQCPQCQKSYRVTPEVAGKRLKCRTCNGIIAVPANVPSAAPATSIAKSAPAKPNAAASKPAPVATKAARPKTVADDIANGFSGPIVRVRASLAYRFAQLIVAIVMLLLPVAYCGVIAGVCYLVYLHATTSHVVFQHVRGRAMLIALSIYVGPLFAGVVQVLFMLKPFFAPSAHNERSRAITPQGEPHVFALVQRIAEAVGSPLPKKIEVNCDMNAAAAYQRGLLSLFLGGDLKLIIGMPLAAGLSLQQFAGVLAHEFGHFSQGGGMRLSYLIRRINGWFARCVYERDAWDEWLVETMQDLDFRIAWMFGLARLAVYLTRRILWVFMYLGGAVSGYLMRQMEYNADLFETRLVGSETFAATTKRIFLLSGGWQVTQADVFRFLKQSKMPDNLTKLALHNANHFPPDVLRNMRDAFDAEKTGLFDTHPASRDRIAASAKENAPGVFKSARPASDLFVHFESLCKNVSWDLYCVMFDQNIPQSKLDSTDELLRFVQPSRRGEAAPAAAPYDDSDRPIPLAGD